MKRIITFAARLIPYAFVLLFIYAAVSKLMDFENFRVQLAQSPMLSAYAGVVSYGVIALELLISLLLLVPKTRKAALYASFGLMAAFTVYIYLILNYSDFVPCSCGGILEKLGWKEHLFFNIIMVGLACTALFYAETKRPALKTTAYLLTGAAISSAVMVALFLSSEYIIKKENNFTRRFLPNFIIKSEIIPLSDSDFYFAGVNNKIIYFGSRRTPLIFLSLNLENNSWYKYRIYPDLGSYNFKNLRIAVKDSYYYLYDGTVPIIYRGKIGSKTSQIISYQKAYFSQLAVLDSAHFAIRTQSSKTHVLTLAKLDLRSSQKIKLYPKILKQQQDGIFDLDGQIIPNLSLSNSVIYAYLYRNQFVIIDSSFKRIRYQKTIDQQSKADIQIVKLSNGDHKMKAPPTKVNAAVAAFNNYVFILSERRGRHEPATIHRNRKTIDIYSTESNQYVGSFYIPEQQITGIIAINDGILTLSGKNIYMHKFRKTLN
ncbi:hypothetical protein SAMN05660493_00749 [Epilithonimonas bovis DSM 19482]|uniref:Methylamine utilisation protein MauE domain-containing protein n=1 Tax=Epilithonimonas bovis DSM 19482 TaxID=1121284 RepID=A0A1U7PTP3_9FLAO|nr:MauE/DoxX family redox-associated membrane protein [Epilithonimonas bovis]SIT96077.1 hypothetical protein SAMN05660493_00749 [Epilithonimonas bovis DSM 19482]